jgi:hypothetical protein
MLQYFPKIQYPFDGGTFEVTDLFKSITVVFDSEQGVYTTQALPGERPDQLSNRVYQDPKYFWSLFLTNDIKNPLREWAQTEQSYIDQIESEYSGWEYQFANVSDFKPSAGATGFTGAFLQGYTGTNLDLILPGDLLIYETGTGPFSIKCYGAGGFTSSDICGGPHYGQSIIPDTFNKQSDIRQVSSGNHFSACLDSKGYIYAWGKDVGLAGTYFPELNEYSGPFTKIGDLYRSKTGNYTFINGAGDRLFGIKDGYISCFGTDCDDYNSYYAGQGNITYTAWTNNMSGGVAIKNDGTTISFGLSNVPASLYSVDCGESYCVGILPSTFGLTAFGSNPGYDLFTVPGVTGITMISVTDKHALALKDDGTIYGWGMTADGQLNIPTGTYSKISAGRYHSAALNTDNEFVIWGKILKYGESLCSGQTLEKVTPVGLSGAFDLISSGYEHVVLKGTDTNKKYVGVVETVDTQYKRIFVKTYQFYENEQILFDDPSGTIVSIWRYDTSKNRYIQIKTIQNQLLSIRKYLDSTKYINQTGNIVDVAIPSNWETIYILNYQTAETNEQFITLRKELLDIDLYNKTQIKTLSPAGNNNLETAVKSLLASNNTQNVIKISDL